METRTIETLIQDINHLIIRSNFSESTAKELNEKLASCKDDKRLMCSISNEYFTDDNPPYTVLTGDRTQKVISLISLNELKDRNLDSWEASKIYGYNTEIMELVKETEKNLSLWSS